MAKENWEKVLVGKAWQDNDANDYYISWADLSTPEGGLEELFEKYLGTGDYGHVPVIVKVRMGAIFITLGGKNDKPRETTTE